MLDEEECITHITAINETPRREDGMQPVCKIEDCDRPSWRREYCSRHYHRLLRNGSPAGVYAMWGEAQRFAVEVSKRDDTDECILWPFGHGGYGAVKVDGKTWAANRYVCFLAHGEPSSAKLHAAHSCGNGHLGCVNPRHLRWASPSENQFDREMHGTSNHGERNGISKLTNAQREQIRLVRGKEPQSVTAAKFGVDQSTISRMQSRGV